MQEIRTKSDGFNIDAVDLSVLLLD